MPTKILLAGITLCALSAGVAKADLIFSGSGTDNSDNSAISASVDFSLSGNVLTVVLTNTAGFNTISQGSVLTNLGWTVAPDTATPLPSSAGTIALTPGSSLVSGTIVDTTDALGTEWNYTAGDGASSSGFGVGAVSDGHGNLCGSTTCTGAALDGAAFGLVGIGADLSLNGLKPANTYVEDSVTITLDLASAPAFSLSNITSVDFQYGTGSGEGDITVNRCTGGSNCNLDTPPIPEPASMTMLGTSLIGLCAFTRRRWKIGQDRLSSVWSSRFFRDEAQSNFSAGS
jgi:hypothetical protein